MCSTLVLYFMNTNFDFIKLSLDSHLILNAHLFYDFGVSVERCVNLWRLSENEIEKKK